MTFTDAELRYLSGQVLGRLATVDRHGAPQNNPVAFVVNADTGTIDIGGHRMGATRKFANVRRNAAVAFVIDDIVSTNPWQVRCLEIRGRAEALSDQEPPRPGFSREIIRVRPERIFVFGIEPGADGMQRRDIAA
jgi:pyridoxamine 5'-phosphate oxidase family protein